MEAERLKDFLDQKVDEYNRPDFIAADPVSIPHLYTEKRDIEIAGFFAAVFAWGNRSIIISKSKELMALMDHAPYQFIIGHTDNDLKRMLHFRHRTFNTTDLLYFIAFLRHHYAGHPSLETAFSKGMQKEDATTEAGLVYFHRYFFSLADAPGRTRKHIATPERKSHCKRLNMFLRWMVRRDNKGVDFGLWKEIRPAQLVCPIDVHVARVAARLHLLTPRPLDWRAALELTGRLRIFDPLDPVKYDFALFGLGVSEKLR